jgi:hypothetical protein
MLARNYYNTVRKEKLDKLKSKTIVALLRMLKDNKFIYHTRVSIDKNAADTIRKLI